MANEPIKLTLKGSHAERGVSLANLESFIDHFLAALRAFQRDQAGVPASKTGIPERAAAIATAFRLVQLEAGSAIATLEPEAVDLLDEKAEQMFDQEPPQVTNLLGLLDRIEEKASLPRPVSDSLLGACRALGDDGSIGVVVARPEKGDRKLHEVVIDAGIVAELAKPEMATTKVDSIAGHLHRIDLEPDKIGVRTAQGVDWTCDYPAELEPKILSLVGGVIWATGEGVLQGPRRGVMKIGVIESAEPAEQSALFSNERIPDAELAARQGIDEPQGLETLGVAEWADEDDAYLAALIED
ncbi:hypothetical protein BH24ACT23_BH24ACT23_00630 [soil metagenome]